MNGRCCTGEGRPRRLARRLSGAAASLVPGAVLVLLPKCPLCLAAWLTLFTGIGVSAAAAARLREISIVFFVGEVAVGVAQIIRRRQHATPRPRIHNLFADCHSAKGGNADWSRRCER
jgi:hypothetical protein